MKHQKQKLYLHELCAHEGFKNLNSWSEKGYFLELTLAWPLSQDQPEVERQLQPAAGKDDAGQRGQVAGLGRGRCGHGHNKLFYQYGHR